MHDPFEGMAVFVRVVEAGGFTRAADELGLTKSTVSESVRRLETRLGARLLHRTTRKVVPTEAGAAFYVRARKAMEEALGARSDAGALHAEPVGRLRVGSPEVFTRRHLAPLLPALLEAYPGLQVEFVEGVAAVDLLEAGIDVAIRIAVSLADNLVVRRLGTSRIIVVGAPAYLDRRGVPAHPDDIARHDLIGFAPLHWSREWRFTREGESVSRPVRPAVLTNSGETLRSAALAGVGLTALPSWMVADDLASGALTQVLADWRAAEAGIYAVYPSNRLMAAKVRLFADMVAQRFKVVGLVA